MDIITEVRNTLAATAELADGVCSGKLTRDQAHFRALNLRVMVTRTTALLDEGIPEPTPSDSGLRQTWGA